jgi:uncharacterized protein YbjT (DUF2867 family)
MRLLVTGGTGVLGHKVVEALSLRGIRPRVLSRRPSADVAAELIRGDLLEASSLPAALDGVETVLHLASNPANPRQDLTGTTNLLQTAKTAGVGHFVLISIVGVDRLGWVPYYQAKRRQEGLVEGSGIPYTVIRAAQFHDFVAFILSALGQGPLQFLLGGFRLQPVQLEAVAARLVEAALGVPAGRLPDVVGPEPRTMDSLGREWMMATGSRKPVLLIPVPGVLARRWQLVGGPEAQRVGESWTRWLAEHAKEDNPYGGVG